MVGTLTDGDSRRALIAGASITDKVEKIMHRDFNYISIEEIDNVKKIKRLRDLKIWLVPVLDEKKHIVETINFEKYNSRLPFDAILMVASGLAGILLFLMLFSEHPTVQVNLQLLLLNPLPLFFVYPVVKAMRRHRSHLWWRIWKVLIILFFIGGFFQKYAEGTYILALSLLIRIIMNVFKRKDHAKSKKDN